jgi:hypothetical protein
MPRFNLRLRITALFLVAVLTVPLAATAAPGAGRQPAGPGLLSQIWLALTNVWGTGVTSDSGCHWDPNGRCLPGSAAPAPAITPDSGCHMDPDGRCGRGSAVPAPAITPDSGCHMDPNGGCLPGS